jgi:plasmid stabilization system protein ParE
MMQVRWTADAVRDLTGIGDFTWGEYGSSAARNVALRIQKNVDLISAFQR